MATKPSQETLRYSLVPGLTPARAEALRRIVALSREAGPQAALKAALRNDLERREGALEGALRDVGDVTARLVLSEQEADAAGYVLAWRD